MRKYTLDFLLTCPDLSVLAADEIIEIDLSKSNLNINQLYENIMKCLSQLRSTHKEIHAKMRFSQAMAFSLHTPPIILCGKTYNDFKFNKISYVKG